VQALSNPPTQWELAQFLDPDGRALSFRLERSGGETVAHPTGQFGRMVVWFIRFICAVTLVGIGVRVARDLGDQRLLAVVVFFATPVMILATYGYMMRFFKWCDQFYLVHGPFSHWNAATGTIELTRMGITLRRDQLVGIVYLTGNECWGGRIRWGACCPLSAGLPEGAGPPGDGWHQVSELSVIAQADDGSLARYPLITLENPWRFREFAAAFATEFGLPLQMITLDRATRRELRADGWKHPGEFADADRPRKVVAGRVAVSDGSLPGLGTVSLCRPKSAQAPTGAMGDSSCDASSAR